MDSLEKPGRPPACTTAWFWVLIVMSALQLLVAWYCPVLVIFLGFLSDSPLNSDTALTMLGLSVYWLFINSIANLLTLCLCIYAAGTFWTPC
jgi:hypothetical protein